MLELFGFGALAAIALASALYVVASKNLIRAALWLGVTLLATAGLYAMLGASFLAGVQVLLYVGGVITLMIFGVMITRRHEGILAPAESTGQVKAAAVAVLLFASIAGAVSKTPGLDGPARPALTAADLGRALLVENVFAFEVLSLLLLGAIIGAIVIARKRDVGAVARTFTAPIPHKAAPTTSGDEESRKVAA